MFAACRIASYRSSTLFRANIARISNAEVGDFVPLRADGQYAYQLAVVVDDAAQGVNSVVRGVDLLDSTARQIWLQQRLRCADADLRAPSRRG